MPSAPKWLLDISERLLSPNLPMMEVSHTEFLSKTVKKIRFEGSFRELKFRIGYYMDFRISDTEVRRYTPSYVNTENGVLELIAHLHSEAPGSRYMRDLEVGDKVNIPQPRGHQYYDQSVEKYVLFGDETSLGTACSFMPVLTRNGHQFQFYFELEEENRDIPGRLGLINYTVVPKNASFAGEEGISGLPIFQTIDWQAANFVLTGNAKSVQTFRKMLKKKRIGAKISAQGYWIAGKRGL